MASHLLYIADKIKIEMKRETDSEAELQQLPESQNILAKAHIPFRVEIVSLK